MICLEFIYDNFFEIILFKFYIVMSSCFVMIIINEYSLFVNFVDIFLYG